MEIKYQKEGYQILSILDIKKQLKIDSIFSLIIFLFSIIYESFSHGVYSNYMMFAFLVPLILENLLILFLLTNKKISNISNQFLQAGIVTWTIGAIIMGVLEIYGTTNQLVKFYFPVGLIYIIGSILLFLIKKAS